MGDRERAYRRSKNPPFSEGGSKDSEPTPPLKKSKTPSAPPPAPRRAGRLQDEARRSRELQSVSKLKSSRARTAAASQFGSHTRLHFMLSLMFVDSLRDVIREPTA